MLMRNRPRPSRIKLRSTDFFRCSSSSCEGSSNGSSRLRTSSASSPGPPARFKAPLMRKTGGAPATITTSDALRLAAVESSLSSEAVDAGIRPDAEVFWLGAARFSSATIRESSSLSYSPIGPDIQSIAGWIWRHENPPAARPPALLLRCTYDEAADLLGYP